MAKNYNIICPVCGQEFTGSICERCGWVHINMPEKVDVRVEDFQRRRLEAHKKAYTASLNRLSAMEKETTEIAKDAASQALDANNLRGELKKAEDKNRRLENDLAEVRQMLEDYRHKILEAKSAAPAHKLKGIALITGEESRTRMFLPVYEGMNTYGSAESDGKKHFKITMLFRGLKFKPQHFAIETYGERLVFHDLSNSITESASPIPTKGMKTTPAMKFRLNENYYIIISEI